MKINDIKPIIKRIEKSDAAVDSGFNTYNESGYTYNEAGKTYGGIYNSTGGVPIALLRFKSVKSALKIKTV